MLFAMQAVLSHMIPLAPDPEPGTIFITTNALVQALTSLALLPRLFLLYFSLLLTPAMQGSKILVLQSFFCLIKITCIPSQLQESLIRFINKTLTDVGFPLRSFLCNNAAELAKSIAKQKMGKSWDHSI